MEELVDIISALEAASNVPSNKNPPVSFPDGLVIPGTRLTNGFGALKGFGRQPTQFIRMTVKIPSDRGFLLGLYDRFMNSHTYKLGLLNWCEGFISYTQVFDGIPVISYPFGGCYMILFDVAQGGALAAGRYVAHVHTGGDFDKKAAWDNFVNNQNNGVTPVCGFRPEMPFSEAEARGGMIFGLVVNPYSSPRLYSFLLKEDEGGEEDVGRDRYRVAGVVKMRSLAPDKLRGITGIPLDAGSEWWQERSSVR